MTPELDPTLIVFALGAAALAGQSWANTRNLGKGQDRLETGQQALEAGQKATNAHLATLNGTTGKHAGQLRRMRTEIHSLPCREGGDKWTVDDCDAAMDDED